MLIRAFEHSKVGPGSGTMSLDDKIMVMPFLRCVKNIFPYTMVQDFTRTIPSVCHSLETQNEPPPSICKRDVEAMFLRNVGKIHETRDDKIMIAKASVNPIILLLCFDQGVTNDTYYTPMASPRVNGRSLDSEHVQKVCRAVLYKESNVFASEDYTIVPFYVMPGSSIETNIEKKKEMEMGVSNDGSNEDEKESVTAAPDGSPLKYKCILNRDRNSNDGDVVGKRAHCLSKDGLLSIYNTVSYSPH
jgi:hypothetical protein